MRVPRERAQDFGTRPGVDTPGRVLIGGVGYRNLRDFSVGPILADRLAALEWPDHVTVEDLSYSPVAAVHRLREEWLPFERVILVGGVRRGREPGTITVYRWDGQLPGPAQIQSCVAEAVTGVISLDNLLIIGRHFRALPDDVVVIEVEPGIEGWGEGFSEPIARAAERVVETIRRLIHSPEPALPHGVAGLGGQPSSDGP